MSVATAANQTPTSTAAETESQTLGWMQGFPPPPDKTITFQNGSFRSFPELRWAWSNIRQFVPTVNVWRGQGPRRCCRARITISARPLRSPWTGGR